MAFPFSLVSSYRYASKRCGSSRSRTSLTAAVATSNAFVSSITTGHSRFSTTTFLSTNLQDNKTTTKSFTTSWTTTSSLASSSSSSLTHHHYYHHHPTARHYRRRFFSTSSTAVQQQQQDYTSKLGVGGHKWDRIVEASQEEYNNLIQTSLQQGITTFESGQEGGEQVLVDAYRQCHPVGQHNQTHNQVITMSARVGYRTVMVDQDPTPQDNSTEEDTTTTTTTTTSRLLPHDVLVEQQQPASKQPNRDTTTTTTTTNIVHNTSSAYIVKTLQESPLCQLYQENPDNLNLIYMLHNPEVQQLPQQQQPQQPQGGGGGGDPQDDNTLVVYQKLVDAFVGLEQCVKEGLITSFGVCSNGLSLDESHPLFLHWKVVVDAAHQAALEVNGSDHTHTPKKSSLTTLQFPLNLMETNGFLMARDIQTYFHNQEQEQGQGQDSHTPSQEDTTDNKEIESSSSSVLPHLVQPLDIWAMRPLTCYPNQGVGEEHPYQLIDYPLPTTTGAVQWTHEVLSSSGGENHNSPPPAYTMALNAALSHFDGTELLEVGQDRPLTMEERETLDGCKLLQSMIHDLDVGLDAASPKFPSLSAYEHELYTQIIPLIYDTFEELDEDSATVLQQFFAAHGVAVRQTIAHRTRNMLLHGDSGKTPNWPKYTISPGEKLQDYAMKFLVQEHSIDKVIVGYENASQVVEGVQVVKHNMQDEEEDNSS